MKTLPKFAGDYVGEFPATAQRFHALAAKQPLLEAASESAFAADQKAAQQVKDLDGTLAREEARPTAERDKAGEEALKRQLTAAREARGASEKAMKAAVALSYGTRQAFESTIKLVEGTLVAANAKLEPAIANLPKVVDLEFVREQRAALEVLDEQVDLIKSAPAPKDEVLARALAELSVTAARGAIGVSGNGALILPQVVTDARPIIGTEGVKVPDTFAMVASLFESRVAQQVEAAVNARYADIAADVPLTAAEKKQKLAALAMARAEVEQAECAAVFALWAAGHSDIGLRADTSPLAILGVTGWKARPRREEPLPFIETWRPQPRPQAREWIGEREAVESARR